MKINEELVKAMIELRAIRLQKLGLTREQAFTDAKYEVEADLRTKRMLDRKIISLREYRKARKK